MEQESNVCNIKLPSNTYVVNPNTLWNFVKTISGTGEVFTKDQLIKSGLYTKSDDTIKRNLSYLKYLGIIDESRERKKVGEKKELIQKFSVLKSKEIKDINYQIKADREENAKKIWGSYLKDQELFNSLKNNFFKDTNTKTVIDLENFLREKFPNRVPSYIQNGIDFIVELLSGAELLKRDGNNIILSDEVHTNDVLEKNKESEKEDTFDENDGASESPPEISTYRIKIEGPGISQMIELKDTRQVKIVDATWKMIKEEFNIDDNDSD